MKKKHSKHHGPATKSAHHGMYYESGGKETPVAGGNLKLPTPSQAIHVVNQKDKMAGNVGGAAHMQASPKSLGHQDLKESSGKAKGAPVKREKY